MHEFPDAAVYSQELLPKYSDELFIFDKLPKYKVVFKYPSVLSIAG
jgi:hypothetical protein